MPKHVTQHKPCRSAFTLVEILIVVSIIGMLSVIAIPGFARARAQARNDVCITNLKMLRDAVDIYALENKLKSTETYNFGDIAGDLTKHVKKQVNVAGGLECPSGGTYTEGATVADDPICSIPDHKL